MMPYDSRRIKLEKTLEAFLDTLMQKNVINQDDLTKIKRGKPVNGPP